MIYCAIIAFFLCFVFIFYISRHSWASIAKSQNVPVAAISEAMGHTSERTTRIYLKWFDNTLVDSANQKVLSAIA